MGEPLDIFKRALGLHEKIAADIPQLRRGMVWCTTCGRSESVEGADCLRNGWPKCCGYTMTIDSPDERAALTSTDPTEPEMLGTVDLGRTGGGQ